MPTQLCWVARPPPMTSNNSFLSTNPEWFPSNLVYSLFSCYQLQRGAMDRIISLNQLVSRAPVWFLSNLSNSYFTCIFLVLIIPTISSIYAYIYGSVLQFMVQNISQNSLWSIKLLLFLSQASNIALVSQVVIAGFNSWSRLENCWKLRFLWTEYFLNIQFWSISFLEISLCIFERIKRILGSTGFVRQAQPPIWSFISGCLKMSYHEILLSYQTTRAFLMKSFVSLPIFTSQGKPRGLFRIASEQLSMFLIGQGAEPQIISQRSRPRLQISLLEVQGSPLKICGAMQMGVPHISSYLSPKSRSAFLAKPKSANLIQLSLMSTFSGLTSRCMQELSTNALNPLMMPPKILTHSSSFILVWDPFIFLRKSVSHSSNTMQLYFLPRCESMSSTMLGDLIYFMRVISRSRAGCRYYSLIFFMSICLIATSCPVFLFLDLNTRPQLPYPSNFKFSRSQSEKGNYSRVCFCIDIQGIQYLLQTDIIQFIYKCKHGHQVCPQ